MMVGRELTSEAIVIPDLSDAETVLDIRGLNRGREIRDVSFPSRKARSSALPA